MISVICVYNDEASMKSCLGKSLKAQTAVFEPVLLDNSGSRFRSAAEALNFGGRTAKGEYLMFVHQDVDLCSPTWLEDAERILSAIPGLGVAGVAGKGENEKKILTNIRHGIPPEDIKKRIDVTTPQRVQTLDECLAIVPRAVFKRLRFDESTCDSWHAYVVDYCLSVKELGLEPYVLPLSAYHKSRGFEPKNMAEVIRNLGRYPKEYYRTLERILIKHGKKYRLIRTTCGDWYTGLPFILQRLLKFPRSAANFYKHRIGTFLRRFSDGKKV